MPRQAVTTFQHAFNKGELSPDLQGRRDWPPLYHGLSLAENVIVKSTGGAVKCSGTKFIAESLEQDRTVRFIPFDFGNNQSYILEFGDRKFRILHKGGLIVYPAGHEKAGEIVVIDSPFSIDQMQPTEINVQNGERAVDYCQDEDTLILVHPDMPPKILTRHDHHDWRFSDFSTYINVEIPKVEITVDGGKGAIYKVSAVAGGIESYPSDTVITSDTIPQGDGVTTLKWQTIPDASSYKIYKQFDPGSGKSLVFNLIGTTSSTTYTDSNASGGTANTKPVEPPNPFYGPGKYPSICTFHNGRLIMGSPKDKPNRINGSRLSEFKNFKLPDVADDATDEDAFEWSIRGAKILLWFASMGDLIIGSSSGEYRMAGNRPAVNPDIVQQSNYGNSSIKPILFRGTIIGTGSSRESITAFQYDLLTEKYGVQEISHFSNHIFQGNYIRSMCGQMNPFANIYAVLNNGELAIITYMKEEEVLGVTRRNTDGIYETAESIATINGKTDVYFEVLRNIDGVNKRYLEVMQPNHFPNMPIDSAWYVDCGLEYSGDPKSSFTGLGHLEGKKVSILADGIGYGYDGEREYVITDGTLTLPYPHSHVIIGLPYTSIIRTIEMGQQGMSPAPYTRQPVTATIEFYNTRDCLVSCEGSEAVEVDFLDDDGLTTTLKNVSRTVKVPADPDGSNSSRLTLQSNSPVPWGIMHLDMVVMAAQSSNRKSRNAS